MVKPGWLMEQTLPNDDDGCDWPGRFWVKVKIR